MASTSIQRMFSLEGHTAVITGGTRGIGQAVAIGLAEAGADILLIQVNICQSKNIHQSKTEYYLIVRLELTMSLEK